MKRSLTLVALALTLLFPALWAADAWARAGGGSSSGSRGSRSYSAPARPSPGSMSPSRPATPPSSFQQPAPQRSGWMGGLMGGIGGLVLGGLLGSMLFGGGMGQGLGGGIGLMEIVILGALAYFAFSWFRRRQQPIPATPAGHGAPGGSEVSSWQPGSAAATTAAVEAPAGPSELDLGIAHIRQMDAGFDPRGFAEKASDIFFKLQAAWMARDMGSAREVVTPEMHATLQKDCDRLRQQRRVNHLENIAVRSVEATEAWQEAGQDFVTMRFLANLLDYTVDEATGQVVEGSRTEPVKFEEYWTFARPVGPNAWRLSAIQQA
ncbi:MAG: hypothetical protein A2X52_01350 [Candidatus Rokubacteria bacterium GWC2_70_16]|nr:MAG: hypothetical protein A2X52_01350 [Candidatus Rokubacteria bacterium GWC2_70_16]